METLILRHTLPTDIDMIVHWERDPDNAPFIGPWARQGHLRAIPDPDIEHLVVEVGRIPVGFVILAGLAGTHDSIEFRRVVISNKGKGYGRATVEAVMELAFESRGAHRLWLDVKDDNLRARNLYESLGFEIEGRLRECYKVGDRYESLIVMSMLSHEYRHRYD